MKFRDIGILVCVSAMAAFVVACTLNGVAPTVHSIKHTIMQTGSAITK